MKPIIVKIIPMLIVLFSLSATAQINSSIGGYMHGTYHKGDTGSKSEYDADKVKHDTKADTTVIKRVPTKASEAKAEAKAEARHKGGNEAQNGNDNQPDTTSAQGVAPFPPDTAATAGASSVNGSATSPDCNCASPGLIHGAIALLGLLSLIGLILIFLLLRKRKEEDENKKS